MDEINFFTAGGGPLEKLFRRHCGDPEHIRAFLEALQSVLRR